MYKILIVDDEPIAVQSVEYMIAKNFEELKIAGAARTGKDAIEKAFEVHPDIIIMDINMPGINGIDAMKQIRINSPNVKFIVVSAFDYFDYAVESVALGVEEYLLKPLKEARLVEILKKVLYHIEKERKTIQTVLEQKERIEMVTPILECGFINSLCIFDENEEELRYYSSLFDLKIASGYVMAIEFGQKSEGEIKNKIGAGVHTQKKYDEYRSIIKSFCECIVGPIMLNRIIVYVIEDVQTDEYEEKSRAIRLAEMIGNKISKIYPDAYIGIGHFHKRLSDGKKSYHEALQSLQFLSMSKDESQILHVDDILEKVQDDSFDYENTFEKEVLAGIEGDNIAGTLLAFDNIFSKMSRDDRLDFKEVKIRCVNFIVGFAKSYANALGNYGDVLIRILEADNKNELHNICRSYIGEAASLITSAKQRKIFGTIEKADAYMEKHFSDDISLEDIAKEVNLSSYYFSRFYKSATGINFSDRLTGIRIEKAKDYLKGTELSIKEVSYMVGYTDPNYFSKMFKKITGCTASEYKKLSG